MPKVTIWIRNEDYAKWKAIDNKPEWLHKVIQLGFDQYQRQNNPIMVVRGDMLAKIPSKRGEPTITPPEEPA